MSSFRANAWRIQLCPVKTDLEERKNALVGLFQFSGNFTGRSEVRSADNPRKVADTFWVWTDFFLAVTYLHLDAQSHPVWGL